MFRILRYLILISLISSGYYLFIYEYLNISEKYIFEEEIIKKEKVEDTYDKTLPSCNTKRFDE